MEFIHKLLFLFVYVHTLVIYVFSAQMYENEVSVLNIFIDNLDLFFLD